MGVLSLSARTARFQTSPGRVSERQTLPLLGLGQVYSRSTQRACGTVMRSCASLFRRRRGPAELRDLFLPLSKLQLARPALRAFCVCEVGGGITTLGVLRMLPKRAVRRCQNG